MKKTDKYTTFLNPNGLIEHRLIGRQTPESMIEGIRTLMRHAKKVKEVNGSALILVEAKGINIDTTGKMTRARQEAIKALQTDDYDRMAVYGNMTLQVMVCTLSLVADQKKKVRAFSDRLEAVRWLKNES